MWESNQDMISEKISKSVSEKIEEILTFIRNKEINVRDIVFCGKELENVIFLEPPSQELIQDYEKAKENGEKHPPFVGEIMYKTLEGRIGYCPVASIVKISSGKFFGKYHFQGKNREVISRNKEILARQSGFRAKRKEYDISILLKIYGDSQEEVDKFIQMICKNDFKFFPFYRK